MQQARLAISAIGEDTVALGLQADAVADLERVIPRGVDLDQGIAAEVVMLRLRVITDCQPRTKNGHPAHSTTGVAETN